MCLRKRESSICAPGDATQRQFESQGVVRDDFERKFQTRGPIGESVNSICMIQEEIVT
jgi:hypothetical protein